MKIIIFFVMNAFLIKENRDFPLIKDYHSNLQSSLSYFIFFPSFCYIWSSCNKEKNKPPFLMQKMSLKLRVNSDPPTTHNLLKVSKKHSELSLV